MKQSVCLLLLTAVIPLWGRVMLAPGASIEDGIAKFKGEGSFLQERNSSGFATRKGVTISAAVRLRRRKLIEGSGFDENKQIVFQHDIIAAKGKTFVFGRRRDAWVDQMYINFFDGEKWCVPLAKAAPTPTYNGRSGRLRWNRSTAGKRDANLPRSPFF